MSVKIFKPYLEKIEDAKDRAKVEAVFDWIDTEFPDLVHAVKWSTPMYTKDDTFIIAVKPAKKYFSINPEAAGIETFSSKIKAAGYDHEQMTFKIKYSDTVDYELLREIIEFNIEDKKDSSKFWR
ncbi:Intracellular iron chaperone frataxin [Jeotgalicoccus aerolatus]|uniref:Uncharacterized protein YdhG (YjbR/CyaY superfamily) n=1 Tax=Jeotgalicoccus aerolatus TaxID=709510 RepID=A0A1G8WYL6_9STAP|nr:DUF1801 domain-containing protein [Jeotgalicoccus aerolatus]MBP1952461.1 uncharacterized protein YdhG (YjbR/CyaY superfamily) [Jeotgalicoccus aerolatus]NMA80959.1 iron chaperone [Jeotgalicoccus aerolatus]CAD2072504.1 Intracellular iron chaperone frataxin [Jeotgalicoccus aerolatus]SDJ83176.1 hypothetical protein SAMN05216187_1039 [Jeotgalicoccus aerolatus]GGE04468.1 hypothetical protein GCM10007273_16290 [Jeotgalicoccus aerolatus]